MSAAVEPSLFDRAMPLWARWRSRPLWTSASLQGAFSLVDQAIVSGTSFLTSVLIARSGTPETLGAFFVAWNVIIIVQAIQSDLISAPYIIHSRRRAGLDADRYTGSVFVHQLVLIAMAWVSIAGTLCFFHQHGPTLQIFRQAGVAFLAAMPFLLMRQFVRHLSYARMKIGATTLVDACIAVLQLGGLALLAALGVLNVSSAYVVLGLACGIPTCYWLLAGREPLRFHWPLVSSHWRENWSFGRWALASQLTGRATGHTLPWVLAFTHGEACTGLLSACVTLVNMGGTFITGVSNYLTPRAASAFVAGGVPELNKLLWTVAALYGTVIGAFAVFLFILGGPFAVLVYGPDFSGGAGVLRLLAVSLLLNSLSITVGNGLWAINRPDANFTADLCSLVVGLVVLAAAVQPLGAVGAALALCAGNAAALAVRWKKLLTATAGLRAEAPRP